MSKWNSAFSFSAAYRFSSTTKLMSVPRWRTEASKSLSLFCMQIFLNWVPAVEYFFVPSPPYSMLMASTYSIRQVACLFPIYSWRVPPKSLVILYFPSENAPAPPKPLMMEQDLQPMQLFTLSPSIGQRRFSRACPASKTAIFSAGFSFVSS